MLRGSLTVMTIALSIALAGCCGKKKTTEESTPTAKPQPTSPTIPAVVTPAPAGYEWHVHQGVNMKFLIPKAWADEHEGSTLIANPKDGGLVVKFQAVVGDAKLAQASLEREILKIVPDAKQTSPIKPVSQHGLNGFLFEGTGTHKGKKVDWFSVGLGDGQGRSLLSIGIANKGELSEHRGQVTTIFNSIQPAN